MSFVSVAYFGEGNLGLGINKIGVVGKNDVDEDEYSSTLHLWYPTNP